MATKKAPQAPVAAKKRSAKKSAAKAPQTAAKAPRSMPSGGRDPKGGLTAKGREYFNKKEGSHLRPGVQGPADTPEKMVRKGSFLRRHFAHPRGPMKNDKGEPTRLALSAHAWGEPVPNTTADAKKLADEGHELLEQYHAVKDTQAAKTAKTSARKNVPAKRPAGKKAATKKMAGKKAPKKAVAKTATAKKVAAKKATARNAAPSKTATRSAAARKR